MKRALFVILTLAVAGAGPLLGQRRCDAGDAPRGDLGIIINADATVSARPTADRPWRFRSPIEVARVHPGGPAEGVLEVGDLITAIDGLRLTDAAGASRLASIAPGSRASLSITRGSDRLTRSLITGWVCPGDPGAIGSYAPRAIASPDSSRRQAAGVPVPSLPDLESTGWLGLALACTGCGWAREAGDDAPYWESTEPPVIHALARGGPAAQAGLRIGDTLTHVGEHRVTSRAGGRSLGAVQPGAAVQLTIRRAGFARRFTVVPQDRPEASGDGHSYLGRVAGARVEVSPNGMPGVSIEERDGAMLVRVGEAVIRVAPAAP